MERQRAPPKGREAENGSRGIDSRGRIPERLCSRQYEKVLDADTGEREQRTAYEVSVRLIRRKEEAENEC